MNLEEVDLFCCDEMRQQLEMTCSTHGVNCPDIVILRTDDEFRIPIRDGGSSGYEIRWCPFCGTRLGATVQPQ